MLWHISKTPFNHFQILTHGEISEIGFSALDGFPMIVDPLNPSNNVGKASWNFVAIKGLFAILYTSLKHLGVKKFEPEKLRKKEEKRKAKDQGPSLDQLPLLTKLFDETLAFRARSKYVE